MAAISAHVSPQLQAMLQRIKELDKTVRKAVRVQTKAEALPIWREEVASGVTSRVEGLLFGRTARVAVTDRGVRLQAARVGKSLRGGLDVKTQWHAYEFGGDQDRERIVDMRSRKGTSYSARRHTQRQLPARVKSGRVVFPAVSRSVPRLMSLWLQTIVRAGHEALEGK